MSKDPRIYLVLDNCFALKRWIRPADWMSVSREIGFNYVQASTDNEIDPLFSPPEYMDDWFEEVAGCEQKTGVQVVNYYTGYQTYRTVGLGHPDPRYVERIRDGWILNMIRRVAASQAEGIGFSFFAIPDYAMQDPAAYRQTMDQIYGQSYEIARYADQYDVKVSVEQMYVPYQPPFTIRQSCDYMERVYRTAKAPLYITIDTGHMIGQHRFVRPSEAAIRDSFKNDTADIWLGADELYRIWQVYKANGNYDEGTRAIADGLKKYEYLFSQERDSDVYAWLRSLGKYSPIIHMQQTNGVRAGHVAFTPEANADGIITGERLMRAIKESYDAQDGLFPGVDRIYLSFELFFPNTAFKSEMMRQLRQTLEYWRRYVPEDGMRLSEAVELSDMHK